MPMYLSPSAYVRVPKPLMRPSIHSPAYGYGGTCEAGRTQRRVDVAVAVHHSSLGRERGALRRHDAAVVGAGREAQPRVTRITATGLQPARRAPRCMQRRTFVDVAVRVHALALALNAVVHPLALEAPTIQVVVNTEAVALPVQPATKRQSGQTMSGRYPALF